MKHFVVVSVILLSSASFAQPVLYPLHLGDVWQYRSAEIMPSDTFVYSYKAVSDTIIATKSYTVIFYNGYPSSYERQSGDSVFVYRSFFQKELLYFDFSRSVGDTVSSTSFGNDTTDVVLKQTFVGNYFGTSRRAWVFYVNQSRRTIDDEYSVIVADSLGIVRHIPDFGPPMALVGAIIDGRQYGNVTSVFRDDNSEPKTFMLSQNYPNPFNSRTKIDLSLERSSYLSLDVFNVLGEHIANLANEVFPAGQHRFAFEARNLSTGTYYYKLTLPTRSEIRKMLLIK